MKRCKSCRDTGYVCENHPQRPWIGFSGTGCDCGGAGMPCACTAAVPQNGKHSITECFTPSRRAVRH